MPSEAHAAIKYLATVYPESRWAKHARLTDAQVVDALAHVRSLHWYYTAALGKHRLMATLLHGALLVRPPAFECMHTSIRATSDTSGAADSIIQQYTANELNFPSLLPCTPGAECVHKLAGHVSPFARARYFEVWHFALKSKREPSGVTGLRWQDWLDGKWPAPTFWFWHAPGSGIFYDAGLVLAAPSKACMLVKLLVQWLTAKGTLQLEVGRRGRQKTDEARDAVTRLMERMRAPDVETVVNIFNETALGKQTCAAGRIPDCQHGYFLMDRCGSDINESAPCPD